MNQLSQLITKVFISITLGLSTLCLNAVSFEVGDLKYSTLSGNNVTLAGPATDVTITDLVVPEQVTYNGTTYNVTQISDRAFINHSSITSIKLHDNIVTIGAYAFMGTSITEIKFPNKLTNLAKCVVASTKVKKIVIPNSVTALGGGACCQNYSLESIEMSNNVRTIDRECFNYCGKLSEITLPATLTSLGAYSFTNDANLTKLTCLAPTPPTCPDNPFTGTFKLGVCKLIVPAASVEAYKQADFWKDFANIEAYKFPGCALMIQSRIGSETVQTGQPYSLQFKVLNIGTDAINSMEFAYSIAGQTGTTSYTFPQPFESEQEGTVVLDFPSISQEGDYEITLTPAKANGAEVSTAESSVFKIKVGEARQIPEDALTFTYAKEPGGHFGLPESYNWNVAMRINDPTLIGMKVVGMKVFNLSPETSRTSGWLSTNLSGTPDIQTVAADPYENAFTVVFPEPYVITGSGVYVGYEMTAEKVNFSNPKDVPGSCYLTWEPGALGDFSSHGAANIIVYLTGDFKADCVAVEPYDGNNFVVKGEKTTKEFNIKNQGSTPVTSVGYEYTINGQTVKGTAQVSLPAVLRAQVNIPVEIESLPVTGTYPMLFTLTTVNGKANACADNHITVPFQSLSFHAVNRPLMEEATGTWCGWCTRGWRAMELMGQKIPEFIGLAWHNKDPMTVTNTFPFDHDGFPSAALNRTIGQLDPYFGRSDDSSFGMYDLYVQTAQEIAPADINLSLEWNNDSTAINAITDVHFAGEFDNYKIGYVLGSNGYSHPDERPWYQENYYAGGDAIGDLAILCEMSNPIESLTFNDVAIGVGDASGVANSLPSHAMMDQTYTHKQTISTNSIKGILAYEQEIDGATVETGYELIENKKNLFVVAMLIAPNGRVMNSCKVNASSIPTSITNVIPGPAAEYDVKYYDLLGRRIPNAQNGLIIRVNNGKASKIML